MLTLKAPAPSVVRMTGRRIPMSVTAPTQTRLARFMSALMKAFGAVHA
jgi:hypothetical protein